jgi:hypothetical protein
MKAIFLLVVVLAFLQNSLLLAKRWHRVDIDGVEEPFPRVGMGLAPFGDSKFYFFAGGLENISGTNSFFNDLWLFEFDKCGNDFEGEWTLLSPGGPIPSTRAFAATDVVTKSNGKQVICVFGGGRFDNVGNLEIVTDKFFTYNIETDTWTDRSSLGGPVSRLGSLGVGYENSFYVHAGLDASFNVYDDLWVFNIDTLTWSQITPSNAVRPDATIAPVGDILLKSGNQKRLVVTSGTLLTEAGFGFTNKTMGFDFNTNVWIDLTPVPSKNYSPVRTFTAATASRDREELLMYGGDQIGGVAGCGNFAFDNPSNDTWIFNVGSEKWKEVSFSANQHPSKLKRHGAVQVDKYYFVLGGYDFVCPGPGQVHNHDVHVTTNR